MTKKGLLFIFICILIILSAVQFAVESLIIGEAGQEPSVTPHPVTYSIFIDIEDKTLFLLEDGKCIKTYPIASGASGLPSPLGLWKIVEKGDWGEGFGGRWMGLNVPWGTYGIHGTSAEDTIGSAASHGCIRMFNSDIKELYDMVQIGTSVHIVNGPYGAFGRGFSDIEVGDRGADVMAIQERLKELGYFRGCSSGIYEDDLKHALHRFQRDKGLEVKNTITREDYLAMGFRDFE
ncbi:MAG TPA: L,D-transpeptidase family protein [Clostridia bacterium]|nr:L,D-transpeptidase family protein [Clostridia bacterium]